MTEGERLVCTRITYTSNNPIISSNSYKSMSSTYKARLVKQFHAKKIINDLTQLLSSIISTKAKKQP